MVLLRFEKRGPAPIIVEKRWDDFMAYRRGARGTWEAAATQAQAIQKLQATELLNANGHDGKSPLVVVRRSDDVIAYRTTTPRTWEAGDSTYQAVGKLAVTEKAA